MSVAFESNSSSNSNSNRIQLDTMWIYNTPESARFAGANPWSGRLPAVKEEEDSSSSSSIGNNSDAFSGGGDSDDDDDGEVQSKDNGLLNGLNELEEVLPIKRGLSTFYAGKSKSYGSLADAVSAPSIQDIVKPDDAYSRKRKNMLAHHVLFDKNRETTTENGISKRPARNSHDGSNSNGSVKGLSRPPLPRNSKKLSDNGSSDSSPRLYMSSPWRSLSLSDLQNASSFNGAKCSLCDIQYMAFNEV